MKKILISLVILLSLKCNVYAKTELKIGAILPLSGEHQLLGKNIYQSILITIFELKNLNIKVIPLDTQVQYQEQNRHFKKVWIKR